MLPQQYCLRWKYHHSNLQTMFTQLLERQAFCDVTLACEGQTIKAHKMVLSACSTYFDTILSQYEEKDPILIMKDVKFVDIKCLVEFMYKGEINVEHCHLATLLKTAEELRIKGLAEVSWREDDVNESASSGTTSQSNPSNSNTQAPTSGLNGMPSVIPQITMDTSEETIKTNRKRGRPPIDDYDLQHNVTVPPTKIQSLEPHTIKRNDYEEVIVAENDDWDDDVQSDSPNEEQDSKHSIERYAKSENGHESDTAGDSGRASSSTQPQSQGAPVRTAESMAILEAQWPDVVKMNDYLNTGRRPQFWEEPFTKRVMDAIKSKELEMKAAAELLGVSYGTLYGRYRDAYGCLKHPYRVRDFWSDQGPADILAKLQRQEVTLFRAAELLNVTPQTLSNYLISLNSSDPDASTSNFSYEQDEDIDDDSGDDSDGPGSSPPSLIIDTDDKTVLPNHPDITIIKKEKKQHQQQHVDEESDQ